MHNFGFLRTVTNEASAEFIPAEARVAVFDMDGTLMCELFPAYFEWLMFTERTLNDPTYTALDAVRQEARSVLAFGNSSGDASMMTYTIANNPYQSMAFLVVNDDTQREYGEPEKSAKMKASAEQNGWTVISMRDDFKTIYGENVTKKAD